jgi:hypothetical protein
MVKNPNDSDLSPAAEPLVATIKKQLLVEKDATTDTDRAMAVESY